LRGSHGLILALAIGHSTELFSQEMRELIVFYMGGISVLSLTIQGTTIRRLIKFLNIRDDVEAKMELKIEIDNLFVMKHI